MFTDIWKNEYRKQNEGNGKNIKKFTYVWKIFINLLKNRLKEKRNKKDGRNKLFAGNKH